jgi:hypothetical protein
MYSLRSSCFGVCEFFYHTWEGRHIFPASFFCAQGWLLPIVSCAILLWHAMHYLSFYVPLFVVYYYFMHKMIAWNLLLNITSRSYAYRGPYFMPWGFLLFHVSFLCMHVILSLCIKISITCDCMPFLVAHYCTNLCMNRRPFCKFSE